MRAVERKGGLREFLRREKPDILCLQETKAEPSQLQQELRLPAGYRADWCWAQKKGYSGVATWTKPAPRRVEAGLDIARFDAEGRVLMSEYDHFTLFNIYFPNGKRNEERLQYKLDFYDAVLERLKSMRQNGVSIVVCGDVNTAHQEIDLARPKENSKISGFLPQERQWLDRLLEERFLDCFRLFEKSGGHYTWWDMQSRARERNVGWRIDYFFVSQDLRGRLRAAFHRPQVLGSDHCPVGIELEVAT